MSERNESGGGAPSFSKDDLVVVARAVKTRGLRGELVADLLTDFPERFGDLERLLAVMPDGHCMPLKLEDHWLQGARIVLKFAEYDSVETAHNLVGCEFAVPASERVKLPEDEYYDWELAGCRVETIKGEDLGRVREVMRTGGVEMLVVDHQEAGREYLIPLAETICVLIDVDEKLIRVDAPEGLLEF